MEIVALAVLALAWFYHEEIVNFMQLDRVHRMASRALDRQEAESIKRDVEYYVSQKLTDEQIMAAMTEKERFKKYRDL